MTTPAFRDDPRYRDFHWTSENAEKAKEIIARYPEGRQQSAIMPLLWLAQYQMRDATGSAWLPLPVIEYVADQLGMPHMRALEVVSFYTQFNQLPVGRNIVQVCGTTPCMLRGSDDIFRACRDKGIHKGEITEDGLFTLVEVECIGCCANGPVAQVNERTYEDLDYDSMTAILEAYARGETPKDGSQIGRTASCPEGGPTTLTTLPGAPEATTEPS